jgi:hypothetical protein
MTSALHPRVVSVACVSGHVLHLTFANGEKGLYSVRHLLQFGVFAELADPSYFAMAKVQNGTVVWPNGQDICPDTLYLDSDKLEQATPPEAAAPSRVA